MNIKGNTLETCSTSSWWLNQPIFWEICAVVKVDHETPRIRVKEVMFFSAPPIVLRTFAPSNGKITLNKLLCYCQSFGIQSLKIVTTQVEVQKKHVWKQHSRPHQKKRLQITSMHGFWQILQCMDLNPKNMFPGKLWVAKISRETLGTGKHLIVEKATVNKLSKWVRLPLNGDQKCKIFETTT